MNGVWAACTRTRYIIIYDCDFYKKMMGASGEKVPGPRGTDLPPLYTNTYYLEHC